MATSKLIPNSGYAWMLTFMSWGVPSTPFYNLSASGGLCDSSNPTTGGNCGLKYGCQVVVNDSSILQGAIPFYPPSDFYRCLQIWMNVDFVYEVLNPGFVMVNATKGNRTLLYSSPKKLPFSRGDVICQALRTTDDFVTLINQVNAVTANFSAVPAFAIGAPFDYYYQYIGLNETIASALGYSLLICFGASFIIISIVVEIPSLKSKLLVALWASLIITAVVTMTVFEIWGFIGYAGIDISAVPAISIIMSCAVGVDATVPLTVAFISARGTRLERVKIAFSHMLLPVMDGLMATFCGIVFIAASPFAFIQKYFFLPYLLIITFAAINGFVVLPFLLGTIGPFEAVGEESVDKADQNANKLNKMVDYEASSSDKKLMDFNNGEEMPNSAGAEVQRKEVTAIEAT